MIGRRQQHREIQEQHPQHQPQTKRQCGRTLVRECSQQRVGAHASLILLGLVAFLLLPSPSSALVNHQQAQRYRQQQQRQRHHIRANLIQNGSGRRSDSNSACDLNSTVGMKANSGKASGGSGSATRIAMVDDSDFESSNAAASARSASSINSAAEVGEIFGLSEEDTKCVSAIESMVEHQTDFLSASVAYTNAMEIVDDRSNNAGGGGSEGNGGSDSGSMGQINVHEMLTGFTLKYPSDQIFDTYKQECLNIGGNFLLLEEDYFSCQASSEDGDAATYFGLTNENDGTSVELFVTVRNFSSCISTSTDCQNFSLEHLMVEVWNTFGLVCIRSNANANSKTSEESDTSGINNGSDSEDNDSHKDDTDDGTPGKEESDESESGSGMANDPEKEQSVDQKQDQQEEQSSGPSWYDENHDVGPTQQQGEQGSTETTSAAARNTGRSIVRLFTFMSFLGFIVAIVVVQRRRQRRYEREVTRRIYEMTDVHFVDQIVDFHDNDFIDDDYDDVGSGGFKDKVNEDEYEDINIDDVHNDGDHRHRRIV